MITYYDVQNSSVAKVAGCNPASATFADIVNEAIRRIMRRGDWPGTIAPIQTTVTQGIVAWPRYVGQIRKLNWSQLAVSGMESVMPITNLWYHFVEPRGYYSTYGSMIDDAHVDNLGRAPTYATITGTSQQVRAYPATTDDVGKTLTIYGTDNNNVPLRTNNLDGTWSDGVTITVASPFGSTSAAAFISRIDRVRKDVTQGQIFLYSYNTVSDTLDDIAIYDPGETNPSYVKQRVRFSSCATSTDATTAQSVVALVKLAFIPVKYPSDLVIVDNLEAIKSMVQSLKLRESNDFQNAIFAEADAIRELNRQLEDESPDDQFYATNNPIGKCSFTNKCF
jgi:hypothetical protein